MARQHGSTLQGLAGANLWVDLLADWNEPDQQRHQLRGKLAGAGGRLAVDHLQRPPHTGTA